MIFYDHSAQNLCLNSVLRKKQKKNEGRVSTNDYVNNKNCFKTHILGKKVQSGRLRRLSPQYGLPTGPRQTTATNFFFSGATAQGRLGDERETLQQQQQQQQQRRPFVHECTINKKKTGDDYMKVLAM